MPVFILIHSPLVGPFTWKPVAGLLESQGWQSIVPTLTNPDHPGRSYWDLHSSQVAQSVQTLSPDVPLILVGHSGAGVLLPAIAQACGHPVQGYIFVDAGLPVDGHSRLDHFESPEAREEFRASAQGGSLPTWSDEDLHEVIPDASIRRQFVSELRPVPLAIYEEPIPVFSEWPDAACAYVRFGNNPAYQSAFDQASGSGWAIRRLDGEHFHMLVDPQSVAEALVALLQSLTP